MPIKNGSVTNFSSPPFTEGFVAPELQSIKKFLKSLTPIIYPYSGIRFTRSNRSPGFPTATILMVLGEASVIGRQ